MTRVYQRTTPLIHSCAHPGRRPVISAPNQPITTTKKVTMDSANSTMYCGMAKMMRNATVRRFCGDVPANHMSTRLVGIGIAGFVMVTTPSRARPRASALHDER